MAHNEQGLAKFGNLKIVSLEPLHSKDKKDEDKNQMLGFVLLLELLLIELLMLIGLSSAQILPNPLLYVRPSTRSAKFCFVSYEAESIYAALAQGRLFCKVSFCVLALCALQMCLTWCVGYVQNV
jgi:hypothetical protein